MNRWNAVVAVCAALVTACPPPSTPCADGHALCGGSCIDVSGDLGNCGGCGVSCPAAVNGTATCQAGHCGVQCTAGAQLCGARLDGGSLTLVCSTVATDPTNCGACGQVCLPQQSCSAGRCTDCPAGQLQCPVSGQPGQTACHDVQSDDLNCGGCGLACQGGRRCDRGLCVAATLASCGGVATDLDNDPAHCGACGTACVANEACRGGACRACASSACGNSCVNLLTDPANCGACGTSCTGTQACVRGACAAPVAVRFLGPAAAGAVPSTSYAQLVRVDSALPVARVQLNVSLGATDGGTFLTSLVDQNLGGTSTWSGAVNVPTGGVLTVTVYDVAYREGAPDAALHLATATTGPLQRLPPPTTTPTLEATAGGVALPANGWLGLDAPTVRLTATNVGAATAVAFINRAVSDTFLVGTADVDGGAATLVVSPAELATGGGVARVVACPVDAAGQRTAIGSCSTGAPANTVVASVGRVPATQVSLTADRDGGAGTLWYLDAAHGLYGVDTAGVLPGLPASPVSGTPYLDLAVAAENPHVLLALWATGVDRFDCPVGGTCAGQPFVTSAGPPLATLVAQTPRALLLTDTTSQYVAAVAPPTSSVTPLGLPTALPPATTAQGALVVYVRTSVAGPYQLKLVHPALPGGVASLGPAHTGAPLMLSVQASGEVVWAYPDAQGNGALQAASFDGTTLKVGTPATGLGVANGLGGTPVLVAPRLVAGTWNDRATATPTLFVADLRSATPTIVLPTPVDSSVGPVVAGVATRTGAGAFAVSDDRAKLLYVTSSPVLQPTASHTVRLLDLATLTSGVVYAGTRLTASGAPGVVPHFVHGAGSWASATIGASPPAGLAPVPVVVFSDALEPAPGSGAVTSARLFFARYDATSTAPTPVQADRLLSVVTGAAPGALAVAELPSAELLLFPGPGADWADLYALPLAAPTGSVVTATRVLDAVTALQARDDTGRVLALRSDGSLWSAATTAGQPVALSRIGEGGWSGVVPQSTAIDLLRTFGFTPEGTHAWMLVGVDASWVLGGGSTTTLRLVDLATGQRRNLGAQPYAQVSDATTLPCFVDGARTLVGFTEVDGQATYYVEDVATGVRTVPPSAPFSLAGVGLLCQLSADTAEAVVAASLGGAPGLFIAGPSAGPVSLLGVAVSGPALTTAPSLAAALPEYQVLAARGGDAFRLQYKRWGRDVGGVFTPSLPLGPWAGSFTLHQGLRARGDTAGLWTWTSGDAATTLGKVVPLSGHAPAAPLLP